MKKGDKVRIGELPLASVVDIGSGESYSHATIKKNEGDWVTLYRPYTFTSLAKNTESVHCYVGIEELVINADNELTLIELGKPSKSK